MNIYNCQPVPSLQSDTVQAKINEYNEQLTKWGKDNDIEVIKPGPALHYGTGETIEYFYLSHGWHQGSLLNRHGVVRLSKTITEQCPSLKDVVN